MKHVKLFEEVNERIASESESQYHLRQRMTMHMKDYIQAIEQLGGAKVKPYIKRLSEIDQELHALFTRTPGSNAPKYSTSDNFAIAVSDLANGIVGQNKNASNDVWMKNADYSIREFKKIAGVTYEDLYNYLHYMTREELIDFINNMPDEEEYTQEVFNNYLKSIKDFIQKYPAFLNKIK